MTETHDSSINAARLDTLRGRTQTMLDHVARLVSIESPSHDLDATAACAQVTAGLITELLGGTATVGEGRAHVAWSGGGKPRVLLLGHVDTVWPLGTLARWPFSVADGRATGPGVFDMKAGVVQGLHALTTLDDLEGVRLLLTTDEELGSLDSRELIETTAAACDAVLVLEPSADGALKTARKGVSMYDVQIRGRAAHAGLDPHLGVNALVELAALVSTIVGFASEAEQTTVTPTVAAAGTTRNTVPERANILVDARAWTAAEQRRVDEQMRTLRPTLAGASLELLGGINRPPMEPDASARLFDMASRVAVGAGLPAPTSKAVGGGSDGNFTAALGMDTLDGLGAVGAGAHAEGEHIVVEAMAERATIVAGIVAHLLRA